MKIGLVCTQFTRNIEVLEQIFLEHPGLSVHRIWYAEPVLQDFDCLIISSGLAFPLDIPGSLARLRNSLAEYAAKDGLIAGFGGGFALLLQCGLLPGRLVENASGQHICCMQHVLIRSTGCPGLTLFDKQQLCVFPISHAAGAYEADPDAAPRVVFQYCDAEQNVHRGTSPDGSQAGTAGICSENGRVLGTQLRPDLGYFRETQNADSRLFFKALCEMIS
jgi:phosphoribosylformylglycinamidine synthase subunit PurQ / glutaminase